MSDRAAKLEYAGYRPLQPGRIHLFCPSCGRKQSNAPRNDDPPRAHLAHVLCDRCDYGCKDGAGLYLDSAGHEVDWWEGMDD